MVSQTGCEDGENALISGGDTGGSTGGGSPSAAIGFIYLQVGAYSGNYFQINYADMRATAVFGKNAVLDVMSHSAAEKTIAVCDRAINYVSGQRSRYGSCQNALEHLYASNAITGENVSVSESGFQMLTWQMRWWHFHAIKFLNR